MKNIIYIAGLAMLTFSSCDFLETDIYGSLDEKNLYHDEVSCMAGLTGIYDKLGAEGTYACNLWGTWTPERIYWFTTVSMARITYKCPIIILIIPILK